MSQQHLVTRNTNNNEIKGDKNLLIQDVAYSTINISNYESDEIINTLNNLLGNKKKHLYFVVYADFSVESFEDWKPFKELTLMNILHDSVKNLIETQSFMWFIDSSSPISADIRHYLKDIAPTTIFIFSSNCPKDASFFNCFNQQHIGGCIAIPSCDYTLYETHLDTLVFYRSQITNAYRFKKTFKFALKNVHCDLDIVENINNLIAAYLQHDFNSQYISTSDQYTQEAVNKLQKL